MLRRVMPTRAIICTMVMKILDMIFCKLYTKLALWLFEELELRAVLSDVKDVRVRMLKKRNSTARSEGPNKYTKSR